MEPDDTSLGTWPTAAATTEDPVAVASITVIGMPSKREASASRSAATMWRATSVEEEHLAGGYNRPSTTSDATRFRGSGASRPNDDQVQVVDAGGEGEGARQQTPGPSDLQTPDEEDEPGMLRDAQRLAHVQSLSVALSDERRTEDTAGRTTSAGRQKGSAWAGWRSR